METHGILEIPLPDTEIPINLKKNSSRNDKTALYIPEERLEPCNFTESLVIPGVRVTRNASSVLIAATNFGEVGYRHGDGETIGLEQDPTKKQLIIYAAVVANDHLLWYQRPGEPNPEIPVENLGDVRLLGKYSIGFGGHKEAKDIALTPSEHLLLADQIPGLERYVERLLGIPRGLFAEVDEELGIKSHDINKINLLGAFMDDRITNPDDQIQVGWVHVAIPAVIELDTSSIRALRFNRREVERCWWVRRDNLAEELAKNQAIAGVTVESWTEVMIREFLVDLTS